MPIATLYRGHSDSVFAVAWAPGGDAIASGSRDCTVQIWQPLTGTPITIYHKHSHPLLAVAWSPDGQHIASGCTVGSVRVWQAFSGEDIVTYAGHKRFVRSIAWSPDGAYIASGGDYGDSSVQVWQAATGNHIYTHMGQYRIFAVNWSPTEPSSSPSYLITSPPERVPEQGLSGIGFLQTSMESGFVSIGEGEVKDEGRPQGSPLHPSPPPPLRERGAFSPKNLYLKARQGEGGGSRIASASFDGSVQIWDALHGDILLRYSEHTGPVYTLAWSPDGAYLVSGGHDTSVRVWDAAHGKTICVYTGHTRPVKTVSWSPDSRYIASGSDDTTIQIWQSMTGSPLYSYREHAAWVRSLAWSPQGEFIASTSDAMVHVWQPVFSAP